METARLSNKGQIVLPKTIRGFRAWGPGTEFAVEETADGTVLRPPVDTDADNHGSPLSVQCQQIRRSSSIPFDAFRYLMTSQHPNLPQLQVESQ